MSNQKAIKLLKDAVIPEATCNLKIIKIEVDAEKYYQALAELAEKPKKWVCPDCGVKITGPSYPKLHTCKQPKAGERRAK